jgi:lipoprotein signal peptidase
LLLITFTALTAADLISKAAAAGRTSASPAAVASNGSTMFRLVELSGTSLLLSSLAIAVLVSVYALHRWNQDRLHTLVLALLLAGFAGNLIERLLTGHVRDWVALGSTRWNLADFYLAVAIPWLVAVSLHQANTSTSERR